jgi:hypothetical protein
VTVALRRSARARRLTLRVSRRDGAAVLTLPQRLPLGQALRFLAEREGWLRAALAALPRPERPGPGDVLPVEGRLRPIRQAAQARVALTPEAILLPQDGRPAGPRLAGLLKTIARDRLAAACDRHAQTLGVRFGSITLRDTRSRWGSCSTTGNLMFSWRIAMAPPEVLDYLAAHEVAHLARMDHSPAFWALVARICPGWKAARAWLRAEGDRLLAVDFT